MKQVKRITLGGKSWVVGWREDLRDPDNTRKRICGLCTPGTRTILINSSLNPHLTTDTFIHEMLHAVFPFLEEGTVNQAAEEISKALWQSCMFKSWEKDA